MIPEKNTIITGDCVDVLRTLDDHSVDHCITDPPFNMSKPKGLGWAYSSHVTMSEEWDMFTPAEYLEFTEAWINEVNRVVKPNGNIFIFGSYHNIYDVGYIISKLDLRIINSIIWFKPNAQPNISCRMLTESTEQIIWVCNNSKKKAKKWVFNYDVAKLINDGKQLRNMWSIPYPSQAERRFGKHPSQKPIELISRLVRIASNPGDLILDCFGGSGTTAVASAMNGRNWLLIERDAEYNKIAAERIDNLANNDSSKGITKD